MRRRRPTRRQASRTPCRDLSFHSGAHSFTCLICLYWPCADLVLTSSPCRCFTGRSSDDDVAGIAPACVSREPRSLEHTHAHKHEHSTYTLPSGVEEIVATYMLPLEFGQTSGPTKVHAELLLKLEGHVEGQREPQGAPADALRAHTHWKKRTLEPLVPLVPTPSQQRQHISCTMVTPARVAPETRQRTPDAATNARRRRLPRVPTFTHNASASPTSPALDATTHPRHRHDMPCSQAATPRSLPSHPSHSLPSLARTPHHRHAHAHRTNPTPSTHMRVHSSNHKHPPTSSSLASTNSYVNTTFSPSHGRFMKGPLTPPDSASPTHNPLDPTPPSFCQVFTPGQFESQLALAEHSACCSTYYSSEATSSDAGEQSYHSCSCLVAPREEAAGELLSFDATPTTGHSSTRTPTGTPLPTHGVSDSGSMPRVYHHRPTTACTLPTRHPLTPCAQPRLATDTYFRSEQNRDAVWPLLSSAIDQHRDLTNELVAKVADLRLRLRRECRLVKRIQEDHVRQTAVVTVREHAAEKGLMRLQEAGWRMREELVVLRSDGHAHVLENADVHQKLAHARRVQHKLECDLESMHADNSNLQNKCARLQSTVRKQRSRIRGTACTCAKYAVEPPHYQQENESMFQ